MRSGKDLIFKDKKNLNILLINPFGIGDVLFSTPLLGILKKNLPKASLYYICNKRSFGVLEKCPDLKRVFVFEKGDYKELWKRSRLLCLKEFISFVKKIKEERFDLAIDMSLGHQYSFFLKLLNVPERVGFDYKKRGRFLTKRLPFNGFNGKPIAEYYKDLLRSIGIDEDATEPTRMWWTSQDEDYVDRFFKEAELKRGDIIIGIAPGGGVSFGPDNLAYKRWPSESFARLADAIIKELDLKVILLCAPGEEALIGRIEDLMDAKPIVSPKTTIREAAALMSRCSIVVTNDSGPLHIAVASGTRTLSIFGPSDENVYGPYPKDKRHLCVAKDIECRPCYKNFKVPHCKTLDCLKALDYRDVFSALKEHLDYAKARL